jgi:hypothetical protein
MSYLLHGIVLETSFALELEMASPPCTGDDAAVSSSNSRDDEWEHLWTDVGGEG